MERKSMMVACKMIALLAIILAGFEIFAPKALSGWMAKLSGDVASMVSFRVGFPMDADGNEGLTESIIASGEMDRIRFFREAEYAAGNCVYLLFPLFLLLLLFRWLPVMLRRPVHLLMMAGFFLLAGYVFSFLYIDMDTLRYLSDDTFLTIAGFCGIAAPTEPTLVTLYVHVYFPAILFLLMFAIERISNYGKCISGTVVDGSDELKSAKDLFIEESHSRSTVKVRPPLDRIIFRQSSDDSPNAFAYGTHTIVVTKGLFSVFDVRDPHDMETVLGVLAHEHGHLAHRDGIALEIWDTCFNLPSCLFWILGKLCYFVGTVFSIVPYIGSFLGELLKLISQLVLALALSLTNFTRKLCRVVTGRSEERNADRHAARLGFGDGIIRFLRVFGIDEGGGFDEHPNNGKRIDVVEAEMQRIEAKGGRKEKRV
jgi:Zn-dependent protease with chaperone function